MQIIHEVEYDSRGRTDTNLGKEEELAEWLEDFVGQLRRHEVLSFSLTAEIEFDDAQS